MNKSKELIVQARDVVRLVENLPNMPEAVGSIPQQYTTSGCLSIIPGLGMYRQRKEELKPPAVT